MNILLHVCCAPCAIYPIEELRKEGHQVAGLFYNPNIHPYSEYLRRRHEVEKYSKERGLNVIYDDYDAEKYFEYITYNEHDLKDRCPMCWWLRLEEAARFAKENGFDAFTTTLLGSPYQDHEVIKTLCEDISKRVGLAAYYKDFRPGFKAGQDKARAQGMYMQKYCGCLFSEKESIDRKAQKLKDKGQEKA